MLGGNKRQVILGSTYIRPQSRASALARQGASPLFRRKPSDPDQDKPSMDNSDDLSIPAKPLTRPTTPMPAATPSSLNLGKPPVMPPRAPEPPRPAEATAMPRPIELPRRPGEASAAAAATPAKKPEAETHKLIVGREIALSGEITSCDRLVVE